MDRRIRDLGGWRGERLARMRALILEADPDMTEEWKWMNPVWSHHGIVCTGEAYKKVVKLTFARGGLDPGPSAPLQFQLGRQHAKGDRHPRRGDGRRGRVHGARAGRGGREWSAGEETVDVACRRRQKKYESPQTTPVAAAQPHAAGPSPTEK